MQRKYYKKWINDEVQREYDTDPDTNDYDFEPISDTESNHFYKSKSFVAENGLEIKHKFKRKRMRNKLKASKHSQTVDDFEAYWNEIKGLNDSLKRRAKQRKSREVDGRKALNFTVVVLPNDFVFDKHQMRKHCIEMSDFLCTEYFQIRSAWYPAYDDYVFKAKLVIAHDLNHKHWNNFNNNLSKMNISLYICSYESWYRNSDWLQSVYEWKAKNMTQIQANNKRLILQHLYNRKGFEYAFAPKDTRNSVKRFETQKRKMNVRINIKLDKCAGIESFEYKQSITIDENLAFEQQTFKLSNFLVRECTVDLYEDGIENGKRINLKPEDDQQIFIPIHVSQNERVNEAIARRMKFKNEICKIQQFASKVIGKLLHLDESKNEKKEGKAMNYWRYRHQYYRYLRYTQTAKQSISFHKLTEKWKYSCCHNPNCNLLPLTCDLNRVLSDYLPYFDVLKDILIPYIGYSLVYYVQMNAKQIEIYSVNQQFRENDDGFIDGFFRNFKGFEELYQAPTVVLQKKQKRVKYDGDSSESSSSVPAPILFGDDSWSDND